MIKIKFNLENIGLILFFALLLFIGPGTLFDRKITHDFPHGYFASDAFQHQVRAEAIKDAGNFRYEASYISKGFDKVVGRYPPMLYHLAVIFSYLAGAETYDSIYLIAALFPIIAVLVMYLIIRDFNRNVALMSLPLSILIFAFPIISAFTWGHWPSLLSQFFLVVFFWCIAKIALDKAYVLISIFMAAIVMTHTSEAVFAVLFLGLFFGIKVISKSFKIKELVNIISAVFISFIVAFYYLTIFKGTLAKAETYSFIVEPLWQGNPGFYIAGFGVFLIFIIVGVIFSVFKIKDMHSSFVLAFAMLAGGFLNYIGFGLRSFQLRFYWPIYLSIFFGFGLYILLKLIIKKWNVAYSIAILLIFTIIFSGFVNIPLTEKKINLLGQEAMLIPHYSSINSQNSQGIMDPYHWAALKWLSKKTEPNSKVYFFYGDIYSQDALLRNSKRIHYQIDPDDFIKTLNERKVKRAYVSELPGDSGGSLAVRTAAISFADISKTKSDEYFFGPQDICRFDYLVFDKISRQQVLSQYNLLIASELLEKDYIQQVFDNDVVIILKNNKPGGDCVAERTF